ncbi:MAG: ChaN family lipoprotein [Bacteroidota bacterium]
MKTLFRICLLISILMLTSGLPAQEVTADIIDFIRKSSISPENYVIDKFRNHDVVFLGEHHVVKENLLFVQSLVPELYENGIYNIGMEFGASELQDKLDELVSSEIYNEQLAKEIMFSYNVAWGYQEYLDVYKAAWKLNRSLPDNARKFRIVNLSYIFHWDKFTGQRNPETMSQVFPMGTIDKFRAEIIDREIIQKNEKILALVGTPHAYSRYGSPYYKYNGDNFCDFDHDWLGNRLYRKYPDKVFSIILHQAFTMKEGDKYYPISPCDGTIEKLMAMNGNIPSGFDLIQSPVGKLPDRSINAMCYKDFTLEQLFDGYIFLKPLNQLNGCTVIGDFVNETNVDQALKNFPDPDWHGKMNSLEDVRRFILNNSDEIAGKYGKL